MEPELTAARLPIQVAIADDIRVKIEKGEYQPGDLLRPVHELAAQWGCSSTSVRGAIQLLKAQGLVTGGRPAAGRAGASPPSRADFGSASGREGPRQGVRGRTARPR